MIKDDKTEYPESNTGGEKKGSVSDAGYNERNEKHPDHTKKNPAPHAQEDKPSAAKGEATQDDTGGGHETVERPDAD